MTEKRFVAIGVEWTDGFIQDHIGDRDLFNIGAVCNLLNELSEENEKLKKSINEYAFISDCSVQVLNEEEDVKEDYLALSCKELYKLKKENGQLKQQIKHSQKRTAIISGWLHDEGNLTLDKYEEILDYCYQEYKNEGLIDSNDKTKIFSDFKNFKLQKDMMEINDMLNEYYTADPSLNIIPKLNALLTELKYHRQASNTVEWQAYKEKEFEGL